MKNLFMVALALAAIVGGVWKFYIVPQQEKEKAEIAAAEKAKADAQAKEDAIKAEEQKKKELAAKTEADAKAKAIASSEAEKIKAESAVETVKDLAQKQEELKKLKAQANIYTLALQDWDKKNPYEVSVIKEYQDRASKARDAGIEDAKALEAKKQALTLAQNEQRKAGSQMQTGRTSKDAKGWRYMKEPEGTCHQLPVPKNSKNGPTILVFGKDTRNEDAAAIVQQKVDAISRDITSIQSQIDAHKAELVKIKSEYKSALESKQAEFKPQIEKLSQEIAKK